MNKCSANEINVAKCNATVSWVVKAADKKLLSCGIHLNKICMEMVKYGAEYMQVSIHEIGK